MMVRVVMSRATLAKVEVKVKRRVKLRVRVRVVTWCLA